MTFDGKAWGVEIVGVVKAHVDKTVAPLLSQIETLKDEVNALKAQKQFDPADIDRRIEAITTDLKASAETAKAEGKEKRKAALADLKAGILADCETVVAAKFAELPVPEPVDVKAMIDDAIAGKVEPDITKLRSDLDALNPQIEAIGGAIGEEIAEHVAKSLAEIPVPLTADETKALISEAVATLPPAENGKDADPELVASLVKETVERAVAGWERPQDGKSVTLDDVRPLIEEAVLRVAAAIPVPKDGRDGFDGVEFLRNAEGHLLVTMSNGTVRDLGEFVGKDGRDIELDVIERLVADKIEKSKPPEIERDAYMAAVTKMIEDAVAKHSAPVEEFAPDDVAANVALAVKMMAETPLTQARQEAQPINVYSSVTMPEMKAADTVVNLTVPEQAAPVVNMGETVVNVAPASIEFPKRGKEVTTVTGWDKSGRIKSFEKKEVDE